MQEDMPADKPSSSPPPFQTPEPAELQSEESRASVIEQLSKQQTAETHVVDDSSIESNADLIDSEAGHKNADELVNRQIGITNRSAG
jgi:hypothetical protein